MPGGRVTAREINGELTGYWEGAIAAAGTSVPHVGPQAPVNAIWTCKDTAAVATNSLTFDWAGASSTRVTVFTSNDGKSYRITWIYPGG